MNFNADGVSAEYGHSGIGATQRYAHLSPEALNAAVEQTPGPQAVPPATALVGPAAQNHRDCVALPAGFEPVTFGLGNGAPRQ